MDVQEEADDEMSELKEKKLSVGRKLSCDLIDADMDRGMISQFDYVFTEITDSDLYGEDGLIDATVLINVYLNNKICLSTGRCNTLCKDAGLRRKSVVVSKGVKGAHSAKVFLSIVLSKLTPC